MCVNFADEPLPEQERNPRNKKTEMAPDHFPMPGLSAEHGILGDTIGYTPLVEPRATPYSGNLRSQLYMKRAQLRDKLKTVEYAIQKLDANENVEKIYDIVQQALR